MTTPKYTRSSVRARVRRARRRLTGDAPPRQRLETRPTDRFIASYPRSGNTWMRFLVANLLDPDEPASFATIDSSIPDMYTAPKRLIDEQPDPRCIKTHEPFATRFAPAVYLVRHPGDVADSYLRYVRMRGLIDVDEPVDVFVSDFIEGTIDPFGSWGDHVESWTTGRDDVLVRRYEDLLADQPGVLADVAAFLDIRADDQAIATAVERASARAMASDEQQSGRVWSPNQPSDSSLTFVNAHRDREPAIPPDQRTRITHAFAGSMERFGYSPADGG